MPLVLIALVVVGLQTLLPGRRASVVVAPSRQAYLPMAGRYTPPTPTVTNTPLPVPPTVVPSSTPTVTPMPTGVFILSSSTFVYYTTTTNEFLASEVQNNTGAPVRFVDVGVNAINANGNLVNTQVGYVVPSILMPGAKGCFSVYFSGLPAPPVHFVFEGPYYQPGEEVVPVAVDGLYALPNSRFDAMSITGFARNDQGRPVSGVEVVGTLYNDQGRVVDCSIAIPNTDTLQPGQSSAFKLLYSGRWLHLMTRYEVKAQGY